MNEAMTMGDQNHLPCPWCSKVITGLWEMASDLRPGGAIDCDHCGKPIEIYDTDLVMTIWAKRAPVIKENSSE